MEQAVCLMLFLLVSLPLTLVIMLQELPSLFVPSLYPACVFFGKPNGDNVIENFEGEDGGDSFPIPMKLDRLDILDDKNLRLCSICLLFCNLRHRLVVIGRSGGRQQQTMATFISTEDQLPIDMPAHRVNTTLSEA